MEEIKEELQQKLTKNFKEVVFTGFGEPLMRLETVCNISRELKQRQELTIRIDTNGLAQLIYPEIAVIEKLREATVDELSISLNAENATKYLHICRPKFGLQAYNSVLDFAAKAKKYFKVTFTVVAIPQIDLEECFKIAEKLDIPLRTRHYHGPEIII